MVNMSTEHISLLNDNNVKLSKEEEKKKKTHDIWQLTLYFAYPSLWIIFNFFLWKNQQITLLFKTTMKFTDENDTKESKHKPQNKKNYNQKLW